MKLISPKVEMLIQEDGLEGVYKMIELAGRTCYKSEDRITQNSANDFAKRMIASKHTAMLEHGTIYLKFFWSGAVCQNCNQTMPHKILDKYCMSPYSKVIYHGNDVYVTTNYRVLVEHNWLDDLKYLCEPTEFHAKRITMKFITDRGIAMELIRHRAFSFAQESTRYCNYSIDKFNNELLFIKPSWYKEDKEAYIPIIENFKRTCAYSEASYLYMLSCGATPQEARQVLPNALKTEVIMTGFVSDWKYFLDLRLKGVTGPPHPDMLVLAQQVEDIFKEHNIIKPSIAISHDN